MFDLIYAFKSYKNNTFAHPQEGKGLFWVSKGKGVQIHTRHTKGPNF